MRILLFTGKGGVGKSTVAAGTAALAASEGLRTLVLSTDAAHSLADAFGASVGDGPTEVAAGLFVLQVDAQRRFEESWADVQTYLLDVLDAAGVDPVAAEELTVLPGAEEVLALLELRRVVDSGDWDVVVVDCAPTAETLRLLALPEALGWYMQRILPTERRVVRALRPVLSRAAGVPMPQDAVFDAVERLHEELTEVRALLTGPQASVRLVLTPEQVVLAEARRSWTSLSLYGYTVDGVVVNRVFPDLEAHADAPSPAEQWVSGWVQAQRAVLVDAVDSFTPLPVWLSAYRESEPIGVPALRQVAEDLYAGHEPWSPPLVEAPFRIEGDEDRAQLVLALPLAVRGEVGLVRRADDLVVTCGSYRRVITLPALLTRMAVGGAGVDRGELRVRFARRQDEQEGR